MRLPFGGLTQVSRSVAGRAISAWLVCLMLWFSSTAPGLESNDYSDRESELAQLQQRIGQVQARLAAKRGEQRSMVEALQAAELSVGRLTLNLRELARVLEQQRQELTRLSQQRQRKQQQLDQQQAAMARQIRAAYAMGRQERLQLLLNQQDPTVVTRMMVYYDYLHRARARHMAQIQTSMGQLRGLEAEIARQEQRSLRLHSEQAAEKQRLESEQQLRQRAIASLEREIQGVGQRLARLEQNERELRELLSSLQQALADIPAEVVGHKPFSMLKGKLQWPASGRLRHRFGSPREAGDLRWDGVLISAPSGREVRAVHHGRVAFADWLRGLGLLLIIDHGDGYMTLYGHNQTLLKEAGEWVEAGEPVALVGRSGGRTRSGVYFGIRYNGRPLNPQRWCKRPQGSRVGRQLRVPVLPLGDFPSVPGATPG